MTKFACPKCGDTHIVSNQVGYGVYLPMCLKCGYTGSILEFTIEETKKRMP